MDAQELRNLQEAYNKVHQLDEISSELAKRAGEERMNRTFALMQKDWKEGRKKPSLEFQKSYKKQQDDERRYRRKLKKEQVDIYDIILSHFLDEASGGIIGGKTFSSGSSQLKQKPKSSSKLGRKIGKSLSGFSFGDEKPKDIVKRTRNASDSELNTLSRRSDEKEPGKGRSRSGREFQLKVIEREKRRRSKTNEEVDIYDIILSHLLDERYAETLEAAEAIMVNMSEEWRQSILG